MEFKICPGCGEEKAMTAFKKMGAYRAVRCKHCTKPEGTRYFGKVCAAHPELKGERLSSNSKCVGCRNIVRHNQTKAKYHSDEEYRERYLAKKAKQKAVNNSYSFHAAAYRARAKQATPKWSNLEEIKRIYSLRDSTPGTVVDHFFPLAGETVSGLHVPENLVVIEQGENDRKSNKHPETFYGPDYMKVLETKRKTICNTKAK